MERLNLRDALAEVLDAIDAEGRLPDECTDRFEYMADSVLERLRASDVLDEFRQRCTARCEGLPMYSETARTILAEMLAGQ